MKRCFFRVEIYLPLVMLSLPPLWSQATKKVPKQTELYSAANLTVPVHEGYMIRDISKLKYNCGIKLDTGPLTATAGFILSNTELAQLPSMPLDENTSHNMGVGLKLAGQDTKIEVLCGNLGFSRSISRLKSPAYSFPSPLKTFSPFQPGISPSLPSFSSTNETISFAATVTPIGKMTSIVLPVIQFAFLDSGEKFISTYKKFTTAIVPSVTLGMTWGVFSHENDYSSTWFQNRKYYERSDWYCGEGLMNFSWSHLRTSTVAALCQNPSGGSSTCIRSQFQFLADSFSASLYIFRSDLDVITSNGSEPHVKEQLFFNPQYRFYTSRGLLSLGISAGISEKQTKTRIHLPYKIYQTKGTASYDNRLIELSLTGGISYSTEDLYYEYNGSMKVGFAFGKFKPVTTFSYSNESILRNTYTIKENFNFRNSPIPSINAELTVTEKEGNLKWNGEMGINFKLKKKGLSLNGKFNLCVKKGD
ncbi:MAG: hypothetical protein KBS64_06625 [Treponema sp.]|nr:hypothetical protein [Candidatus Treponema equi]